MPVNQSIYPNNPQVRQLPIYLVGIGGSEYQGHVYRPEGYYWNQLLYSVKGQGCLKTDAGTVTLTEGWFFFLPNGVPHEYYSLTETWEVRWVVFDGYALPQITKELGLTRPICLNPADCSSLEKIYNKMFVAQKTDKVFCDFTCSGLVYDYLLEFYRQVTTKSTLGKIDKSEQLMPILNYIDDHFSEDFSITFLAKLANISPQHLCRIFHETLHMRPSEYVTYRRISEARHLLLHSDIPIAEIGARCGFPDPRYFSTVFKQHENMSPAKYRKSINLK